MTAEATRDPEEMICAALARARAGKVDGFKCLPVRPSKTGKAITFGIQTIFSNLLKTKFLSKWNDEEAMWNKNICTSV